MKLVDKYRPSKFRDVIGQDHAVRILRRLILQGQHRRHLLLGGPVGSGKTTLARIYGNALNCERTEFDGSPCGQCKTCLESAIHFHEYDATSLGADISPIIKNLAPRQIIFLDEAHALGARLEQLLKPAEDGGFTLILATSKPEAVAPSVKSRLFNITLRPMSIAQSVIFLQRIAREEGIEFDLDAFYLLASQCEGQARDLLQALDQARLDGKVTLASVRDQTGISFSAAAVAYLEALASGLHEEQARCFYGWNESGPQKLAFVQNFIGSVYFREVHKLPIAVDPILGAISSADRKRIVEAWRDRVGVPLFPSYLRSLIDFWPIIMPSMQESAINLHVLRFHDRINNKPIAAREQTPIAKARGVKRPSKTARSDYLTFDEVRTIINCASAMVQEYGVLFNTQITLFHLAYGITDAGTAARFVERFHSFLRYHLQQLGQSSGFRISVNGNSNDNGLWTRIIAAVPDRELPTFERKIVGWRSKELRGDLPAIKCDVKSSIQRAYPYHAKAVRWLCEGIDPELPGNDQELLVDALKIDRSKCASYGDIGSHNRVTRTEALSEAALVRSSRLKMTYLLPFDDGDFAQVLRPWEKKEHLDRIRERRERAIQSSDLRIIHERDPEAHQAAQNELLATWDENPRNRERRWKPWWTAELF